MNTIQVIVGLPDKTWEVHHIEVAEGDQWGYWDDVSHEVSYQLAEKFYNEGKKWVFIHAQQYTKSDGTIFG